MSDDEPRRDAGRPEHPHDDPDEAGPGGSEGGEHPDAAPLPFAPHRDDDSPLGDTDQHSDA